MDEALKNKIILILVVLSAIFIIFSIGSCNKLNGIKISCDREKATRFDAEEKLNKFTQEKTLIETKLNSINQELEEEKVAHQATTKSLLQEQLVNQSLKEEIQKISHLKEALEEHLKEALVADKSAAKTKK